MILLSLVLFHWVQGQEVAGRWSGSLDAGGMKLRLVFNLEKGEGGYTATMDSPDQGALGIEVPQVAVAGSEVTLAIPAMGLEYKAALKGKEMEGTFKQGPVTLPLKLTRTEGKSPLVLRPQEPQPPYPYEIREVTFINRHDSIQLTGTLTLPEGEGPFPAVILISGSGPQNRDEEIFGHRPFWVIADHLTRKGIAVLRYDDRGTAASRGNFNTATTLDFGRDAEHAFRFLKTCPDIDPRRIGLLGHSEGGIIASMIAAHYEEVGFMVLLAGTGIRGDSLLLLQQETMMRTMGVDQATIARSRGINKGAFDLINVFGGTDQLKQKLILYLQGVYGGMSEKEKQGLSQEVFIGRTLNQIMNPWMEFFVRFSPCPDLTGIKCPVLALNGSKDVQVPAGVNLNAIRTCLEKGGNRAVTTREYPGLNHLFQECKTGLPSEYGEISQTISPAVLEDISSWILDRVK